MCCLPLGRWLLLDLYKPTEAMLAFIRSHQQDHPDQLSRPLQKAARQQLQGRPAQLRWMGRAAEGKVPVLSWYHADAEPADADESRLWALRDALPSKEP